MATATQHDDDIDEAEALGELLGPIGPQPVVHGFDTAALHLLRLQPENLFERMSAEQGSLEYELYRCKGCREDRIPRNKLVAHSARHRRAFARGDYTPGGAMATATKPKTAPKPTAKDQGFPAEYLAANGNFKPGLDARAKSDLIAAVLGLDTKNALHKFTSDEAARLIAARNWQPFVDKKRATLAAEQERKVKRDQDKANAAKTRADNASKAKPSAKASGTAKPDPKPRAKRKPAGGRLRSSKSRSGK